ncbi:MAG: hypothetical protein MZV70_41790 [Desulfobacterales bacterium]|nr:hypothetical protein [Desulfobacterales bacterium]
MLKTVFVAALGALIAVPALAGEARGPQRQGTRRRQGICRPAAGRAQGRDGGRRT